MKNWTWPSVAAFAIVVAALVIMFVSTEDSAMRERLIGALEMLVAFVVGSAGAAVAGWHRGYAKGKSVL